MTTNSSNTSAPVQAGLPPLPEPDGTHVELDDFGHIVTRKTRHYTIAQMRAYADAAIEQHVSATPAPARKLTDAEAHELMGAMQVHVQAWADKQDLDAHEEGDHPAFSGECIRFLLAHITGTAGGSAT